LEELKAHVELSGVQPLWAEVYSGKGAGADVKLLHL